MKAFVKVKDDAELLKIYPRFKGVECELLGISSSCDCVIKNPQTNKCKAAYVCELIPLSEFSKNLLDWIKGI
jgi:hypothetical protein